MPFTKYSALPWALINLRIAIYCVASSPLVKLTWTNISRLLSRYFSCSSRKMSSFRCLCFLEICLSSKTKAMASNMFDLPILIKNNQLTSTVGADNSCQVEEGSDNMVTLERFKILKLDRNQLQLLLVFDILHNLLVVDLWFDWWDRITTNATRINLLHTNDNELAKMESYSAVKISDLKPLY